MTQSSSQALSQEIKQSAQKILNHLNEFEFDDGSQSNIKRGSEFMDLLSSLQTEESTNLLQDVNKWTEYRRESYQKFVNPLLDQVESNQKIAESVTNEAIPTLQNEMNDFDVKLFDAKSKLSILTENVMHAATDVVEGAKKKGPVIENPQLQLNIPQPPQDDINEKELSRIEYENEIIQQLKKRQEFFVQALQNFDKQIGAIQADLNDSRENAHNLENENKNLKKEIEMLRKRPQLLLGNEIRMEIDCFNTYLEIEESESFEILFEINETDSHEKSVEIPFEINETDSNEKSVEIPFEINETGSNEKSVEIPFEINETGSYEKSVEIPFEINETGSYEKYVEIEDSEKVYLERLKDKMAEYELIYFADESITLEPNNEYTILPRSEADKYFDYIQNNNGSNDIQNTNYDEIENEENDQQKFQYTSHDNKNINQSFDPFSIASEISYEMKVNEKGEMIFDLTDETGNNIFGNIPPESVKEIQSDIEKDIQHLISINSETSHIDNNHSQSNASNPTSTESTSFNVSVNRNPSFLRDQNSINKSKGKVNFPFEKSPFESPQPIVPIGIRQKEDKNGNLGFRIFFKQNNDALILDTNIKQRTNDGLIVLNDPTPNILIRIEDGFSSDFVSRCRENPNLNFILRPYRLEGSKDRVVCLFENNRDIYHSNFLKEKRNNTPCIWSSFPVRPPPPIYRANNRPQTNQIHQNQRRLQSSLDSQKQTKRQFNQSQPVPKEIHDYSPQQIYQMRKSSPSSIETRKNQAQRVRHSYNGGEFCNGDSNSPRKMIQLKNGRKIVTPAKSGAIRKLNRTNEA